MCFSVVLSDKLKPDFTPAQIKRLGQIPIVPAQRPTVSSKEAPIEMLPPTECYFRRSDSENLQSKLFVFIDFGPKANAFLSACGTRHEPSIEEIVQILLADPKRFYRLSGGKERYRHRLHYSFTLLTRLRSSYLTELRNIAVNRRLLSANTVMRMKRSSILLGARRVKKARTDSERSIDDALDEEEWDAEYDLLRPDQIVIADDTSAYQMFGDSVFCVPQEDLLEGESPIKDVD